MSTLRVYSRQGCHLCEQLIEELLPLVKDKVAVEICDVDTRAEWRDEYGNRVPILAYDGDIVCQYHLDRDALAKILGSVPT